MIRWIQANIAVTTLVLIVVVATLIIVFRRG